MNKGLSSFLALIIVTLALLAGGAYFMNSNGILDEDKQVENILEEPNKYYGKNTTVRGEIDDTIDSRTITIDGPGVINDELLVISKRSLEPIGGSDGTGIIFEEDDEVEINGVVRKFHLKEMESLLGRDLPDEEFIKWEGQPVIIAETVLGVDD